MNSHEFVAQCQKLLKQGQSLKAGEIPDSTHARIAAGTHKALIFSPHPDDECITTGLALRLLHEAKWNVINVAVTLGRDPKRRPARLTEAQSACKTLGYGLAVADWENINPEARRTNHSAWREAAKIVAEILAEQQAHVIFVPHEHDHHPTHIGTHLLVFDALKLLPQSFSCHVVETEYWGQMSEPNLLVEISADDLSTLIDALCCHSGEIRRNAYHARLPAWMIDNVRRGAELVGERGAKAPDFTFATIYRLQQWHDGTLRQVFPAGKFLSAAEHAASLFR